MEVKGRLAEMAPSFHHVGSGFKPGWPGSVESLPAEPLWESESRGVRWKERPCPGRGGREWATRRVAHSQLPFVNKDFGGHAQVGLKGLRLSLPPLFFGQAGG